MITRAGRRLRRVQAGQRVTIAEEPRPGQQGHHRLGEAEHHHDVDQRGQAEGVGEALDLADGEVVQQQRGQERHRVGHQDRAPGALPPGLDRRAQLFALAHLVAQSLEVDDERVGGDADGHDQARDAGQLEGEVLVQGEQHHRQVGDGAGDDQAADGDKAEAAVVEEGVDHHEEQPDGGRDQAGVQLIPAHLRRHRADEQRLQVQRHRAELQLVLQLGGLGLGEAAGDLGVTAGDRSLDLR